MNALEYQATQAQLLMLANLVREMPLAEMLSAISRADTLGAVIDPTLWMKGHKNMEKIERLAKALLIFQRTAHELITEEAQG